MRSSATPRSLDRLFKSNDSFESLQSRCVALSTLNSLINQHLPKQLSEQCRVANYRRGILVIEVSSASWLTRLRYEQESLISYLRKNKLIGLSSIQYKINPELNNGRYILQDQKPVITRKISQQSAKHLLSLTEQASPRLKESLIKLAKYATKSDNNDR